MVDLDVQDPRRLLSMTLKLLRSTLYTNAVYLWLGRVALAILGFAFWAVVALLYPPEVVGLAGTAITALVLLGQVAQLGLGYVLIRYIYQIQDEADRFLGRSLAVVVVASLLVGLIFLASLPGWSHELQGLLWRSPGYAGTYLLFVVVTTVWAFFSFMFIAYRRGIFVLGQNLTLGILRIPLVVLLGGLGHSAFGVVAGHGLAVLAGIFLVVFFFLPRCTGSWRLPMALDIWRLAPHIPFALSNMASHLLTVLVWQLLPLSVIVLAGAKAAGFFYVAWAACGIMLIMTQNLALSLFAEGSNNSRELWSQARGVFIVGVVLGSLFTVLVYFLGGLLLMLLFGREYAEQSSGVLKVLAAAAPLAAVTYVFMGIERVRNHSAGLVTVSAMVTVVMLGAIAVLVPRLGIIGAGYGVVAGYGVGALISLPVLYPMIKGSHQVVDTGQSTAP